jgi:hypothetical protein
MNPTKLEKRILGVAYAICIAMLLFEGGVIH